jgi:hypothetical protein
MADFIPKSVVKSSTRKLTVPLESLTILNNLVTDIVTNNPWGCEPYVSGGSAYAGVIKGTERYNAKIVYENGQAKTVGQINVSAQSISAFNTDMSTIIGTAALGTAMGGTPSHDSSADTYSVVLKCNHTNSEKYNVTIRRDSITVSSYEADAIVTAIETWADAYADSLLA